MNTFAVFLRIFFWPNRNELNSSSDDYMKTKYNKQVGTSLSILDTLELL